MAESAERHGGRGPRETVVLVYTGKFEIEGPVGAAEQDCVSSPSASMRTSCPGGLKNDQPEEDRRMMRSGTHSHGPEIVN